MKILSIDLGEKRTGIAICDEKEIVAYPLEVIVEEDREVLVEKISNLTKSNGVEMVLVGLARNMDGSYGKARICEKFAEKIKERLKMPVVLWDERQTTKLAMRYMNESNTKKKKKKKIVDSIAATIILESFIEYKKNNRINLV